ncbi:hypothetical protein BDN72DRAFT_86708 [Pluteus cervinus]|uniref:Uncharacterized protein n=1 Tax=Pluteus cervinus TaxID=181527 RepID=A0ACD3AQ89_9AGAR|nr:hypothetical protein BDN72DRAFT_86708 [Pluteus cervinus]
MFDRIKKHASALVGYHPSPSTSRDDPARSPSPTTEHFYPIPTISLLSSAKLSVSSLSHEGGDDDGVDSDFIPYLPLAVQYERAFPYSFTRAPDASTTSLLLAQRLGSSPTRSLRSLRTRSVGPGSLSGNTTARSLGLSRSWSSDSSGISASSSSSRDSLDSASTATDLNSPLTPRSPHFFAGGSDSNPPSAHSGSSVPTPREGSQTRFPAISDAGASDHDEEHNSEVDSKVDDRTASLDQDPFAKGSVQIF